MTKGSLDTGVYAIVAEFKQQGPILLETEGEHSSFEATHRRANEMSRRSDVLRICIVRLTPATAWAGNITVLKDMEQIQLPEKEPHE